MKNPFLDGKDDIETDEIMIFHKALYNNEQNQMVLKLFKKIRDSEDAKSKYLPKIKLLLNENFKIIEDIYIKDMNSDGKLNEYGFVTSKKEIELIIKSFNDIYSKYILPTIK